MTSDWLNRIPDARTPVLFEDTHLLIVGKPAGMYLPGSAVVCGTDLTAWLVGNEIIKPRDRAVFRPVNRIAATESGIVVYGKTGLVAATMDKVYRDSAVQQTWWAVLEGKFKPRVPKREPETRQRKRSPQAAPTRGARIESVEVWVKGERHTMVRAVANGGARLDMRAYFRSRFHPVVGDRRGHLDTGEIYAGRCFLHLSDLAFTHPVTRRGIKVRLPQPRSFEDYAKGGDGLEDALGLALVVRAELLTSEQTNAFRLLNGSPDGVRGLTVEQYDRNIVVWTQPERFKGGERRLPRTLKFYQRVMSAEEVIHKSSLKDRSASQEDASEDAHEEPSSDPAEHSQTVLENGLRFLVRLNEGLGTGLFLDQRDNRQRLRDMAGGKRVLNTFAHTCGFSVAAAAGGAASTVNVDLSRSYLQWGEQNFAANGLAGESHQFIRAEVFDYLARAAKHEQRFDIILLDPPTFSRSKRPKRTFSLSTRLPELIRLGMEVLAPRATLFVNINSRAHSPKFLRDAVKQGAGDRKFRVLFTPDLPMDFASDPRHSKSLWLKFDPHPTSRPRRLVGVFNPGTDHAEVEEQG